MPGPVRVCIRLHKGDLYEEVRLFGLLATVVLLAFGLAFSACDSGNGNGGGEEPVTESFRYIGQDSQSRELEIIFTRTIARSLAPQTGDTYKILLEGVEVSQGTVAVTGSVVIFTPASGDEFRGDLQGGGQGLTIASIPTSNGAISGFYSETVVPSTPGSTTEITYTVVQDGGNLDSTPSDSDTTTALIFTFDRAVSNLTKDHITISPGTGNAAKDTLTVDRDETPLGIVWKLTVDVREKDDPDENDQGTIFVSINRLGIEPHQKTVFVIAKYGDDAELIFYDDDPDSNGVEDLVSTTEIRFSLDGVPSPPLKASDIVITPSTASDAKFSIGALTGTRSGVGMEYSLRITVSEAGNIDFRIVHPNIDPTVHENITLEMAAGLITYEVTQFGGTHTATPGKSTTHLEFEFNAAVNALEPLIKTNGNDIDITGAGGFAVRGGGTPWNVVSNSGNRIWRLTLLDEDNNNRTGEIQVRIAHHRIDPAPRTVRVFRAIQVESACPGDTVGASTVLTVTFTENVVGLTKTHIELTDGSDAKLNVGGAGKDNVTVTATGDPKVWKVAVPVTVGGNDAKIKIVKAGHLDTDFTFEVFLTAP